MYAQESTTKMTCAWMSRMDNLLYVFSSCGPRRCLPRLLLCRGCALRLLRRQRCPQLRHFHPQQLPTQRPRPGQHLARRKPSRCAKAKPKEKGATTAIQTRSASS